MKRRAVIAFLTLFTIWPLAHRALVAVYDSDPWKLFGWAMYCVPYQPVLLKVRGVKSGETSELPEFSPAAAEAIQLYHSRRSQLGRLASPEPAARVLLREDPSLDGVIFKVARLKLDRETARMQTVPQEARTFFRAGRPAP